MSAPPSDLSDTLWAAICHAPEHPFWIDPDTQYSYADLADQLGVVCQVLHDHAITPGQTVLIATSQDWQAFCTWLGCLLNGAVPIMLAPDTGVDRLTSIADLAVPGLIVTSPTRQSEPWATQATAPVLSDVAPGQTSTQTPSLATSTDGRAYILFTSGSTSAPKGVMISQDSLAAQLRTLARVLRVDPSSRIFNGLVLHHVDGLIQGPLLAASQSATLIRPHAPRPDRLEQDMAWLSSQRATHMIAAPALLDLIDRSCQLDDYFTHEGFTAILSSAARLSPALWDRIEARFGIPVINEYGMTETVAASHFAGPFADMGARHSIGKPVDCTARITDEEGQPVPSGTIGTLEIKGANIFSGYFNDPTRTAQALRDGWFRTGDLARITSSGDYEILGRQDDAINFGGFRIYPDEIDDVICTFPGILEARTIGRPDPTFGAVPVTFFAADAPVPPEAILAHCRARLEARKVPKQVIQLDALPRTASGKVDRPALMAQVTAPAPAVPTTSDLEEQILNVAAQVFGVPRTSLSPGDTPEDVPGWDSYAHTVLMLETEQALDLKLPLAEMMAVETLADLIQLARNAAPPPAAPSPISLHTIRASPGGPTLVALPGMGGQMAYIKHLADHLDPGLALHALTAAPDHADRVAGKTMQDLAQDYAHQIIQANLSGPLVLFGASFGGFLAYETAHALSQQDHPVTATILNDTAVPWPHRRWRQLHRLGHHVRSTYQRLSAHKHTPSATYYSVPSYGRLHLDPLHPSTHAMACHCFDILSRYSPSRTALRLLVFEADERKRGLLPPERHLGWDRFTDAPVTSISLGEKHFSTLGDPDTARRAAQHISEFLGLP